MDSMNDGAEEIFGMEPEEIGGFLNVVFEQLKGLAPAGTALEFLLFIRLHGKMRFTVPMPDAATEQKPEILSANS